MVTKKFNSKTGSTTIFYIGGLSKTILFSHITRSPFLKKTFFVFADKITTEINACILPSLTISESKETTLHEKSQTNTKKQNTMSSLVHWRLTTEKNQCYRSDYDPFQ